MAEHRLDAGPATVHWGFFDGRLPPLITVESGDTVVISTVSGSREQMPPPPFAIPPALLPSLSQPQRSRRLRPLPIPSSTT